MMWLLAVLSFVLSIEVSAFANTYFVDKLLPGSNSNDGLSETTPFLTIQKCFDTLVSRNSPGDTCLVKNGTYSESPYLNPVHGTALAPITIKNYPGHAPVIDGTTVNTASCCNGVNLNSDSVSTSQMIDYITVSGFEIRNFRYSGLKFENSTHVVISGNYIHDNGFDLTTPGSGILGTGLNTTISSNTIRHNGSTGPAFGHGLYLQGSFYTIVNNIIYDNFGFGAQLKGGAYNPNATQSFHDFANSLIANNTISYNKNAAAMNQWPADAGGTVHDNTIVNNIMFQNAILNGTASGVRIYGASVITITNDVFYASGTTSTVFTFDNSLCTSCTISGNSLSTNPSMVNAPLTLPASPDFHLTAGSVAIQFGINLTSTFTAAGVSAVDFDGKARPSIGNWDAGAYQFGGAPPPPAAPTGLMVQ